MCVFMDGSGNLRQGPPSERLHIICLSKALCVKGLVYVLLVFSLLENPLCFHFSWTQCNSGTLLQLHDLFRSAAGVWDSELRK